MKVFPEEAKIWVHRMGVDESDGDATNFENRMATPRNAPEGKEIKKVMRWRMLPIHAAIIFNAPVGVIKGLLKAYPAGTTCADDQGMLPLHLAFRSQSEEEVVLALLDVYPEAMERGDLKGRVPSQLGPKNSTLAYHDAIADAFLKSPSCYYHAARVASADRARVEVDLLAEIQTIEENAKKDMEEAKELYEGTIATLNEDIEQLAFENSELKEKIEWYETKYDGAEEKEQVLVDHTNSLAERLRLTSLSEEHLATKLAKLEGKLMMKNQELENYRDESESRVQSLEERVLELEKALDTTHNKAKSLTEKLQQKVKECNEAEIKFQNERKMFEKQVDASRECLMELIASSKEEKRIYESDSKDLRAQLQLIQSELSKNNQVPRELEQRMENLQNELLSTRIAQAQEKADATAQLENLQREIENSRMNIAQHEAAKRAEAESMIQRQVVMQQSAAAAPAPTPVNMAVNQAPATATIPTQVTKQAPLPNARPMTDSEFEIYVCQNRDDTDCLDDADSLVALTELTDEQREALENLDLSGTKEEIAATLSRVPGLTRNQVNLLVDVAASLAA
jgi:myosin heavy subunit